MTSKSYILNLALDFLEGRTTAVVQTEKCLQLSKIVNERFGVVSLQANQDSATKAAEIVDETRSKGKPLPILAGIPVAIKDNFNVKGTVTTAGSKILGNYTSPYDASIVQYLKESHAIICLKSNMDEFGMGSSMLNSAYGPCVNPWTDPLLLKEGYRLSPGGSSGASAISVASGLVPFAIGSDTGGSVRQPASFCGVVGFKPTYGIASRYGLVSYASSMDTPGILSHSVIDASLAFDCISQFDSKDPTSTHKQSSKAPKASSGIFGGDMFKKEVESISDQRERVIKAMESLSKQRSLQGVTIGFPIEFNIGELDESIRRSIDETINILRDAGAIIRPVSIPSLKYALPCYYVLACAEASSNLARYDGVRYGKRYDAVTASSNDSDTRKIPSADSLHAMMSQTRGTLFGPEVLKRILTGSFVLSKGAYDQYYGKALAVRLHIRDEVNAVFQSGVDVLIGPTSPILPYPLENAPDTAGMIMSDYYTVIANLCGAPAISVPVSVTTRRTNLGSRVFEEHLPISLQIIGPQHHDSSILEIAYAIEQRVNFDSKILSFTRATE